MNHPVKKRVIIVGSAYPLRGGGIATFNERLAQAYLDRGDEVIIYTFSLQYPSFLFPGTTQYSTDPPPENLDIRVKINSINPLNWFLSAISIARQKPDLVVIRYWIPFMAPCLGTIARLVKRKSQATVVAITDNIIPHEKRPGDWMLTRYFTGSVDRFVAMSRLVLSDLNQFDTIKPRHYHPHPLYDNFGKSVTMPEARSMLGLDQSGAIILFFGFIREYKGLDLLFEALNNEKVRRLGIKLVVAGEFYGNEAYYLGLIDTLGISESVILHTRFIANGDVYKYFCACNLVVQPYKDATQSGVTQIAYHFNKPMITTNVGGLSEMIPDGRVGYVVSPDSEEIAAAIVKYFNDGKSAEFVDNIGQEKKRFTWEGLISTIDLDD